MDFRNHSSIDFLRINIMTVIIIRHMQKCIDEENAIGIRI